jgi:CBS domain containing-hemolysin-like protein
MGSLFEYLVRLLLMGVFLCCSAYCSGTETAFFSLSKRQINKFRESGHRFPVLVADLLNKPSELLGSLLLGNLVVNTLFFATSSVLMFKIEQQVGVLAAAVVAIVTFLGLVLFGEILPKSLAYSNPERFSVWVVLPTVIVVRVLTPLVLIFRWIVAEPILKFVLGTSRKKKNVTGEEFKALIEATRERGLINDQQGRLFTEVVNFNLLRVRHVMRPRVDMVACAVNEAPASSHARMMEQCVTNLFVYEESVDNIVGLVEFHDMILHPEASFVELLRPVHYVPEQQTVERLLQFFRKMRIDTAVVVDEYGGVAGSVCVEDVAEELFGPIQFEKAMKPFEQLSSGQYRLPGNLPIHDWIKAFGVRPQQTGVSTVGGWITALLGRIPKKNDVAHWQHITLTVERMQRHRVASVIMNLEDKDA